MAIQCGILVLTGDGKGKTAAAFGFLLRAIKEGRKIFMVQFMKAPDSSGEHFSAQDFLPLFGNFVRGPRRVYPKR